jgi:small GTP-binding protein
MSYYATFKIIIFGDAGCGRAELTEKYLNNLFKSDSKMTIGVDFKVKDLEVDGKNIKLQIFDLLAGERFRFLIPTYVKGAKGGIFLYAVTNYSAIAHIDDWLMMIKEKIKKLFPIIVVGNNAASNNREVSTEEAIEIVKSRRLDAFIECNTKTGENVEAIFIYLSRLMLERSE